MGNDTLKNQLSAHFNMEEKKKDTRLVELNLPQTGDWQGDGIDYINISPVGLTDLGQTLHLSTILPFRHDMLGNFNSISSLWDYIETGGKEDKFRRLPGKARTELKKTVQTFSIPYLRFMVLDAAWQRINQHPLLKEALKESTLPFDMLRMEPGHRYPRRHYSMLWFIEGLEVIRRALKKNAGPNFSRLADGKDRRTVFTEFLEEYRPELVKRTGNGSNNLLKALRESSKPVNKGPMASDIQKGLEDNIEQDTNEESKQMILEENQVEEIQNNPQEQVVENQPEQTVV